MKSSTKGLFLVLLIVMSFVAVPAVFAGSEPYNNNPGYQNDDPGKPTPIDICTNFAQGCVTYVGYRTILIDDDIMFKTPLNWILPQVGDEVQIGYWVNPDGVNVACSLEYIGICE